MSQASARTAGFTVTNSTQSSALVIHGVVTPLEGRQPFHGRYGGYISDILNIRYLHCDYDSGKMTVMNYQQR